MILKVDLLPFPKYGKFRLSYYIVFISSEIKNEIRSLIQQDLDWDYLLQKSSNHRLTPLLYRQLNNICPDSVPQNIMEYLKTFYYENTYKNLLYCVRYIYIYTNELKIGFSPP